MQPKNKKTRSPEERLLAAARGGQINVLKKILADEKPDLNTRDDEELMNIVVGGRFSLRAFSWRDIAPAPGEEGKSGNTALMWACHLHRGKVAHALLDAGADPRVTNIIGETALHSVDGEADLIDKLIAKGADVNAQNVWGATPLMQALDSGNTTLALKLLEHGADPHLKTKAGYSAFDIARYYKADAAVLHEMEKAADRKKDDLRLQKERELRDAVQAATRTGQDITPLRPFKIVRKIKKPGPPQS